MTTSLVPDGIPVLNAMQTCKGNLFHLKFRATNGYDHYPGSLAVMVSTQDGEIRRYRAAVIQKEDVKSEYFEAMSEFTYTLLLRCGLFEAGIYRVEDITWMEYWEGVSDLVITADLLTELRKYTFEIQPAGLSAVGSEDQPTPNFEMTGLLSE